jgi:hypothetical protein
MDVTARVAVPIRDVTDAVLVQIRDETFSMRFDPNADDLSLDVVLFDHDKGFIAGNSTHLI